MRVFSGNGSGWKYGSVCQAMSQSILHMYVNMYRAGTVCMSRVCGTSRACARHRPDANFSSSNANDSWEAELRSGVNQ
eukprot:5054616-Amphidinium_carterae.1